MSNDAKRPSGRACGCEWEYRPDNLGDRWLVFTRRCDPHSIMCRDTEGWEDDLLPPPVQIAPGRRVPAIVDHARASRPQASTPAAWEICPLCHSRDVVLAGSPTSDVDLMKCNDCGQRG